MKAPTLMIALALLAASCGDEEPKKQPKPPAPIVVPTDPVEVPTTEDAAVESEVTRTWFFTCKVCGSSMTCGEKEPTAETEFELTYESPTASIDCASSPHDWRAGGLSSAHDPALRDGTLLLVKRGEAYGAFILGDQTTVPERMTYRFWYRTDGVGIFDASSPAVKFGSSVCDVENDRSAQIAFGAFRVGWSGNTDGFGFIYYSTFPGQPTSDGATLICVTDAKEVAGIDAADPKWVYQASPVD